MSVLVPSCCHALTLNQTGVLWVNLTLGNLTSGPTNSRQEISANYFLNCQPFGEKEKHKKNQL
jgi:hypothetical protein